MFPCITPVSAHFWPPLEKGPFRHACYQSEVTWLSCDAILQAVASYSNQEEYSPAYCRDYSKPSMCCQLLVSTDNFTASASPCDCMQFCANHLHLQLPVSTNSTNTCEDINWYLPSLGIKIYGIPELSTVFLFSHRIIIPLGLQSYVNSLQTIRNTYS